MLPGETISSGAPNTCRDCHVKLEFKVCHSAAGYYIGTWCHCGPYSRESGYFPTHKAAQQAFNHYWKPRDNRPEGVHG